ncbi:MAG: hypothetical protein GXP40_03665 [Chloroflexi bacterium]|nr:hypothetical protein [Chloroflexota bacterium]
MPAEKDKRESLPPEAEPELIVEPKVSDEKEQEKKRRRWLLVLLLLLLLLLCCVCGLFSRYLQKPEPLPEMLPVVSGVNYPPHYLFSIYGIDKPVGVSVSPDGERVYVSETGGERLIKVFDRTGTFLFSFAPPRTRTGERSPVYQAIDGSGRLFITDRLQHAIYVYDLDGNYLDTILAPDMTLSEYIAKHTGGLPVGTVFSYNIFQNDVYYQKPGETEQLQPAPDRSLWSPLGLFFMPDGGLLLTDVTKDQNALRIIPASVMLSPSWQEFDPPEIKFGATGQGDAQFLFPNVAVVDGLGRIYVSDGNNGRLSVWDNSYNFMFNFGKGSGEGALNLPRGMAIDESERLYVVDAVGQNVKVYDVSGEQPEFLFAFGDFGLDDGQFNYPNAIAVDKTGRLYVADRENNRIQVWSY